MASFWHNLGFGRNYQNHHNLQDGLFQIASQTCSILVKVNNTNNICFGNDVGNSSHTFPKENDDQLKILIPRAKKYTSLSGYKQRLSTVLESSAGPVVAEEEVDQWEQSFMLRQDSHNGNKWGGNGWCRPSCIPISVILVLIVLVVLVPLLEHSSSQASILLSHRHLSCNCRISLVETIPEGLKYPGNATIHQDTQQTWLDLIDMATSSIEIASFYWTLRKDEVYPHNSSIKGEEVFQALYESGTKRQIQVKIVQSAPTKDAPNTDTATLAKRKAAQVRSVSFPRLLGNGVLHTKLWLVDRKHVYVGSANMDWRSLSQVKELGLVAYNCSALAEDMAKIFDVYWLLGAENSSIPGEWPAPLHTHINRETPLNVTFNQHHYTSYISSSPPALSPPGRTNDLEAIVSTIRGAEKFVYISVMDYIPLTIYMPKIKYWPYIDDAIRAVAVEEKVKVRMLISWWNHSRPSEDYFLRSLVALSRSYPKVDIAVKRFVVPGSEEQKKIPFGRVNHNKYLVTDRTAYIGTSNWAGDYFIDTAGVGLVIQDEVGDAQWHGVRQQLQEVFERDWGSPYAVPLMRQYV